MNRSLIPGRRPHGRLDSGFAIIPLCKEQPLYDFSEFDRAERQRRRRRPPWEAASCVRSGCRFVAATDWVWQSPELLHSSDLAPSFNNSAAGAVEARAACRGSCEESNSRLTPLSSHKRLERHLRLTYGDQMLRRGKYVAPDQLGPALLGGDQACRKLKNSNRLFQSIRGRIVDSVPLSTFDDAISADTAAAAPLSSFADSSRAVFEWCDSANCNTNNQDSSATRGVRQRVVQRSAKRTAMRRDLGNWVLLYFRARRVCWEFMVHEERTNFQMINLYSEGVLDKWTVKLRFRMRRDAPMKYPLLAFVSRMGLESEPDIVFTTDGFFGDLLVGGLRNRNSVPHRQVSFNTTAQALGLQNGDSVFVVRASNSLRANVETQMEAVRRRAAGDDFDDEDPEADENDAEDGEHERVGEEEDEEEESEDEEESEQDA